MTSKVAIYLAGGIQKGHEKGGFYWGEEERALLLKSFSHHEIALLNPAVRSDDLSDQKAVFGRDLLQVFSSDVVFVDAREKRGLGVGSEMMWAKLYRIPIVTLLPKDSWYHKSNATILGTEVKNWVHPFIEGLSDVQVETIEEGARWIEEFMTNPAISVKGIEDMENAMRYYIEGQLDRDLPMKEILESYEALKSRVYELDRV